MKHEGIEEYTRDIDNGHGYQKVIVVDEVVRMQSLHSKGIGSYTGNGNPEIVGKKIDDIKRAYHLRKVYISEAELETIYQEIEEA